VLVAQCLNQMNHRVRVMLGGERTAQTSDELFDVLFEIIDFMLIIVQYQQSAVTKLKYRDINTVDSCYMRAII
jgi:hypothetical protein